MNEQTIIYINWKRIIELILIQIIKIATFLLLLFLAIYKKIRRVLVKVYKRLYKFSKSKIRGVWILLLIIILFFTSISLIISQVKYVSTIKKLEKINKQSSKRIKNNINTHKKVYKKLFNEKKEIEKDLDTCKKKTIGYYIAPRKIEEIINKYTKIYNVDSNLVKCMLFKESGFNSNAVNGPYVGLAQYCLSTFLSHRKQLGLSQKDLRTNPDASIQVMISALGRGEFSHWPSTYKLCSE